MTELSFSHELVFHFSKQGHVSILSPLAAQQTPEPWRSGGKPQRYLLTRHLLSRRI